MTVHGVYKPKKNHVLFANKTFEIGKFECAEGSNSLQLGNSIVLNMIMFCGPVSDEISIKTRFTE
jgi:hypothetical protein